MSLEDVREDEEWGCAERFKMLTCTVFIRRCRYGSLEPHSIASFVGGTAAQEVIKVITGQFVPFNNTFIYNGMNQTSMTIEL